MAVLESPVLKDVYDQLDHVHSEVLDVTKLLNNMRLKSFDTDSYIGIKEKIDSRLEANTRVYVLISLIVLVKMELSKIFRTSPGITLNTKIVASEKDLSEALGAYKSVLYGLGAEINALKEQLYTRFPEMRQKY